MTKKIGVFIMPQSVITHSAAASTLAYLLVSKLQLGRLHHINVRTCATRTNRRRFFFGRGREI